MRLADFISSGTARLEALYPPQEARNMVLLLVGETLKLSPYAHIIEPGMEITGGALEALCADLARLEGGEPLQYVTGTASFCGRPFKTGRGVLIPRPETELLVEEAKRHARPGDRVIDLCTGSGCIAWTLTLDLPELGGVFGADISPEALSYARNQFAPEKKPVFLEADITEPLPEGIGKFNILTANPPYIAESEKPAMHVNVLDHEPALALFVPDNDPLVFYRAVAARASELLLSGGFGIAEINERFGQQTAGVFESSGFSDVSIMKDLAGKDRFVRFFKD